MKSEWFESAFADFIAESEQERGEDFASETVRLMKLAYVAGAREALDFSQQVLSDELAG